MIIVSARNADEDVVQGFQLGADDYVMKPLKHRQLGRVQLSGVTTTAFLQMNNGSLYAADGSFDRVRVRANTQRSSASSCATGSPWRAGSKPCRLPSRKRRVLRMRR